MASVLKAELKCKDGSSSQFTVETERDLKSLIEGVKKISSEISVVLTEIVEEERRSNTESGERRARDDDEEEEDEEEEGDDEDAATETAAVKLKSERPAKRLKTVPPS
ncbi:calreticulin [Neoarius graeffei]|uniref:calreticulin n=1 Tax=Neoarius graeffei TaxID=443677 RepID=UPI00298CA71B|nr:calreticulin [Neoarius graeffei]